MRKNILFLFVVSAILFSGCATIQEGTMTKLTNTKPIISPGQHPQAYSKKITKTVGCKYLVYLPKGYEQSKEKWPMIFFLHGSGERGEDINKVKIHGPPMLVEKKKDFPFIVVSPQCPDDEDWDKDVLITLLDKVESEYRVDKDRVYLTGLSMGGYGAWLLGIAYPDRFAAVVPICGGGNSDLVCKLKDVPVWVFHGAKDDAVPIWEAESMVKALKECGGNVKFTIYPDAGHNSWTHTYANDELYQWMLQQKISNRKKEIKQGTK